MIRDLFFAEPSVIRIVLPTSASGCAGTRGRSAVGSEWSSVGLAAGLRNVTWYSAPLADTVRFERVALPAIPGSALIAFSIVTDGASNGSGAVQSTLLYERRNVPPVAWMAI